MSDQHVYSISGVLNPLNITEVDIPAPNVKPSLEGFMEFICTPSTKPNLQNLISRYKEISQGKQIFLAPSETNILEKIIYPLKNAKASYVVGNYLGTIAICGMISEMIAIITYDISREAIKINKDALSTSQEVLLFGKKFEKLGQDQRIKVLTGLKIINDFNKELFDSIRIIRKKYLHFFSADYAEISEDSKIVYEKTKILVINLIGQDVKDGKIVLNPVFAKFLEKKGILIKNQA